MSARKKIMLVDDDMDFVSLHKGILEDNGYEVIVAYNGGECREKLKGGHPDLIVLDIMMTSSGDGMYVAQDLRKDEATRDIPIIVLSSVNEVPAFNIGADDAWLPVDEFLEKPVASEQLLEQIKKLLETGTKPRGAGVHHM